MNEAERKEFGEATEKLRKGEPARKLFDVAENGDIFLISNPKIHIKKDSIIAENLTRQIFDELTELLGKTLDEAGKLADKMGDSSLSEEAHTALVGDNAEMLDVIGTITDRLSRVSKHVKEETKKNSDTKDDSAGAVVEGDEKDDTSEKDIIDYGATSATDLVTNKDKEAKLSEEEKKQKKSGKKITLLEGYINSDINNADISLENASIRDKIYLVAEHTGYKITADDPLLVSSYNKYANQFRHNLDVLPSSIVRSYKKRYGKDWKDAIMASYKEGWDRQMEKEIDDAYDRGIESRERWIPKEKKSSPLTAAMTEKGSEKKTSGNPDREYAHQLGQRLDASEARNRELEEENRKLREANSTLRGENEKLTSKAIDQADKMGELKGETESLRGIIAVKNGELDEKDNTISMQKSEIARLTKTVEGLKGALTEAKEQGQKIAWDLYNERQAHAATVAEYQRNNPGTPFYSTEAIEVAKGK